MLSLIVFVAFTACDDEGTTGKLQISITDAPLLEEAITGVHIKILGIEVKSQNGGWSELDEFEEPVTINLLDYQDGDVYFLTEEEIQAGEYKEIRLILDIAEKDGSPKSNSGTYLEYEDGSFQPLFVPSGETSGYKAKGRFEVPAGGVTGLTIDFDAQKAVVEAGNSGTYILKPILRLVENDQVGLIKGEVIAPETEGQIVVYAYEEGTFNESELTDPVDGIEFANAVTSAIVKEDGTFTLAFMEVGTYDLYAVSYDANGEPIEIIVEWPGVMLEAGEIENVVLEVVPDDPNG